VEPEETVVAKQQLNKHVPVAKNTHATITYGRGIIYAFYFVSNTVLSHIMGEMFS
jgi:hypothetical protein